MADRAPTSEGVAGEARRWMRLGIPSGRIVEGATMASGSPSTSFPAFSEGCVPARGSGYGDFCFGRLTKHWLCMGVTGSEGERLTRTYLESPITASTSASIYTKPFPFFTLPVELRHMIYGYLLSPFLNRTGDIEVYLSSFKDPTDAPIHPMAQILVRGGDMDPPNVAAGPQSLVQYLAKQKDYENACASHPGRGKTAAYSLSAYPLARFVGEGRYPRRTDDDFSARKTDRDWHMIHFLRKLGNVSNSMRLDLGSFFWSKVDLECQVNAFEEFEHFLHDRPLVIPNLKSLRLTINTHVCKVDLEKLEERFERLCIHLAKLRLVDFSLHLGIGELEMETAPETFSFLMQLAQLRVAKSFTFSTIEYISFTDELIGELWVTYTGREQDGGDQEDWEDFDRLKSLLTPFSLRGPSEGPQHETGIDNASRIYWNTTVSSQG